MVEQARDQLQQQLKEQYNTILAARAGKLLLATGDTIQAKAILQQVAQELPGVNRPWYYLGLIASAEGDTTSALQLHRRAILTDQADYLPKLAMAEIHFARRHEAGSAREAVYYFRAGLGSWLGLASAPFLHARWKYQHFFGLPNDQVPQGLLHYLHPSVDFGGIADRLSQLHEQVGEAEMAAYYHDLAGKNPLELSPEDIKN